MRIFFYFFLYFVLVFIVVFVFCLNGCIFSVILKCYGGVIYCCGIEIKLYDEKVVFKKKGRK